MTKHILVTGSEGYIGTVMMQMLIESGFEVTGLDSCFFSDGNLDDSTFSRYKLIKKDVRDITFEDLKDKNYNAIIHLAALSNDPLGMLNEDLTFDINYKASVSLAKLAKKVGINRFIFSSSCSLYGDGNGKILDETSPSNPQTAYGKSKILAEQEISELADNSFSPIFMRNATAFGFSPRMRFDIVVNNLTGFAKVENEIRILGDGTPWRPLVHVRDICKAFISVLNLPKEVIHNIAFNVGSDKENYQIKNIAEKIKGEYSNCIVSIAQVNAGDTRDYNVSFEKIKKELDFDINYPLAKGIKELKNKYEEIKLNEMFYDKKYTRLKKINFLLENSLIDKDLRWTKK